MPKRRSVSIWMNIFRAFAARQETEPLGAVEPLHDHALKSARRRDGDMGALRRHLRGMNGGRGIHRQHAETLQAALALPDFTNDARTLQSGLEAIATQ